MVGQRAPGMLRNSRSSGTDRTLLADVLHLSLVI